VCPRGIPSGSGACRRRGDAGREAWFYCSGGKAEIRDEGLGFGVWGLGPVVWVVEICNSGAETGLFLGGKGAFCADLRFWVGCKCFVLWCRNMRHGLSALFAMGRGEGVGGCAEKCRLRRWVTDGIAGFFGWVGGHDFIVGFSGN